MLKHSWMKLLEKIQAKGIFICSPGSGAYPNQPGKETHVNYNGKTKKNGFEISIGKIYATADYDVTANAKCVTRDTGP